MSSCQRYINGPVTIHSIQYSSPPIKDTATVLSPLISSSRSSRSTLVLSQLILFLSKFHCTVIQSLISSCRGSRSTPVLSLLILFLSKFQCNVIQSLISSYRSSRSTPVLSLLILFLSMFQRTVIQSLISSFRRSSKKCSVTTHPLLSQLQCIVLSIHLSCHYPYLPVSVTVYCNINSSVL